MRKIAPVALVLAILAGLSWFLFFRGDDQPSSSVADGAPPTTTPPSNGSTKPAAPTDMPEVAMDADPEGPLRLEGQVIDATDDPVAGARVVLSSNPPRTTLTEEDGSFYFDKLLPRSYGLSARKGEMVSDSAVYTLSETSDPVILRLHQGSSIVVTVTSAGSGRPIQGARVALASFDEETVLTDGDGRARLTGVGVGLERVFARAEGYAPSTQLVQVGKVGIEVRAEISLHRGAPVSGVVIDHEGKPVEDAKVHAARAGEWINAGAGNEPAVTDARGAFTIDSIAAGAYRFVAIKQGYPQASSEALTVDGQTAKGGVEIRFEAPAVLRGTVVDPAGSPVPFATVTVLADREADITAWQGMRRATSKSDGTFEMEGLPRSTVKVLAEGPTASSKVEKAELSSGEANVELVLDVGGFIAGTVVESNGEPVAEVQVIAVPDFSGSGWDQDYFLRSGIMVRTDAGGRFRFHGLAPGSYRVRASRSTQMNWYGFDYGEKVEVGDENVRLILDKEGGIKGTIAFEQGGHPTVFRISIRMGMPIPVTPEDGVFEVTGLRPGTFDIDISGPDFADRTLRDVVIPSADLADLGTIVVDRGRAVTGRVVDPNGRPVPGATVAVGEMVLGGGSGIGSDELDVMAQAAGIRRVQTDDDGRFRIVGLGEKKRTIVGEHPELGRSLPSPINAGSGDVDLTLRLRGFGSVRGKVTEDGKPVAGVQVIATPSNRGSGQLNVVISGDDGSYVFEKLPEGAFSMSAMKASFTSTTGGSTEAVVRVGKETIANIVIEVGELTVTVEIKGEGGVEIPTAQVFLFGGEVDVQAAEELQDVFLANMGSAKMDFATSAKPARLPQVKPGKVSVCVIPLAGSLTDAEFMKRVNDARLELAVFCFPKTLGASPTEQTLTITTPPMAPLPEP